MADPVVVVAVAEPAEGRRDAVLAALLEAVPKVHGEPGCERYALHEREDGAFVMLERWASAAALEEHNGGANLQALGAALAGNLAGPLEITRLRSVPAGDPGKGEL